MNKFLKLNEKFIGEYLFYGKAADHKLYAKFDGSTYSQPVTAAQLERAFEIGNVVIQTTVGLEKPVYMVAHVPSSIAYATVNTIGPTGSLSAPAFTAWYSEEHT